MVAGILVAGLIGLGVVYAVMHHITVASAKAVAEAKVAAVKAAVNKLEHEALALESKEAARVLVVIAKVKAAL